MVNDNDNIGRERLQMLTAFQCSINFKFKQISLLNRALTHRSYVNEDPKCLGNNERLEFLGDSVLGLVTAARLFSALGDKAEGELARIKSFVVSEDTLSDIAQEHNIQELLLVGRGEERSGGRSKKAILADAMEAIFGAAYLDSGYDKASILVLSLINPEIEKVLHNKHKKDYKTLLQEYAQKYHKCCPFYEIEKVSGPDHDRTYWITCSLLGKLYGPASGNTKKDAEQAAGKIAYDSIISLGGKEAEKLQVINKI